MSGLGRLVPPDWEHVEKYPLTAIEMPPTHVPVVAGVNWYTEFDNPVQADDGEFWVARDGRLTTVRGGHCFALEPAPDDTRPGHERDSTNWWVYYDQGEEGACVGFGCSRCMSILNRHRYDAFWLYHEAQRVGGYEGQEGAFVRDGLKVLQTEGHRVTHLIGRPEDAPKEKEGINAYRWATTIDEVLSALGTPGYDYVTILNSWGRKGYPHRVRMPAEVFARIMAEDGEIGIVTDR